jgi:hypothetical protein
MKIAEAHLRNAIAARRHAARTDYCERDIFGHSNACA